jgi:DNA-directed RNA polymerase subunit L
MLSSIYIRAFDTWNISKNTSIRNNSQLEKFVSQFPVWISDNSIDNQKDIFKYNIENDDSNIKLPSLNQLTMYLKYTNKKNEIINITTDDCSFYFGEKKIDTPYKKPLLILELHPNSEIEFSVITSINNHNYHSIFNAVNVAYFYENNKKGNYTFGLESSGQLTEIEILLISITNIKKMLELFLSLVLDNNNITDDINEISFEISHDKIYDLISLNQLIVTEIMKNTEIVFIKANLKHPLSNISIFNIEVKKGNIINIIKTSIDNILKVYDNLKKEINKINLH